jgi:hypothetical protein
MAAARGVLREVRRGPCEPHLQMLATWPFIQLLFTACAVRLAIAHAHRKKGVEWSVVVCAVLWLCVEVLWGREGACVGGAVSRSALICVVGARAHISRTVFFVAGRSFIPWLWTAAGTWMLSAKRVCECDCVCGVRERECIWKGKRRAHM